MRGILLFLTWRKICEAPSPYPFPSPRSVRVSRPPPMNRKEEEGRDLLSAQKVLRGEILGSRRSQSCSGNRLSNSNDWTDPGRLTGWQTLVLLRSLPTIYPPPPPSPLPFFRSPPCVCDSPWNLCSIPDFWPNPFFRSPTPALISRVKNCEGCEVAEIFYRMILTTADISFTCLFFELTLTWFNLIYLSF